MTQPDPNQTHRLTPVTQTLTRPVSLPLGAVAALITVPALLLAGLALWSLSQRPTPLPVVLLATPTLGVPGVTTLSQAVIAYDAPGGAPLGALEPGRAYMVVARSGLAWAQLNVAQPGEPANLVWVAADAVPEMSVAAGVTDLATPAPTLAPQVIYVAAPPAPPAAPPAEPAVLAAEPAPTPPYLVAPATPAVQSVVMRAYPTAQPCSLREIGSVLRICNGVTP